MSFSILEKIAEQLTFCKKCSFMCCVNYGDIEKSVSCKSNCNMRKKSVSSIGYSDEFFDSKRPYILLSNQLTADFYVNEDLGKFMTDIDGYCIYINEIGAEHIGESVNSLRYGIMWSQNVFNEDFKKVADKWHVALEHETPLIYTERRIVENHIRYLIIEAYPVFSGARCKGLKGIIMRITKPVWVKFTNHLLASANHSNPSHVVVSKNTNSLVHTNKQLPPKHK